MDDAELKTCLAVIEGDKALGDWTGKPAVPATNVPATNTADHTMWVEINANGATITAVKVDGVTIGNRITGLFRVRSGSTIAIVYTVATPTWQWFHG